MNAAARPVTPSRRVVATLIVATFWAIIAHPLLTSSPCPSARMTHHPCPGCGMTRACLLFLHGDVGASLVMHPLAIPTVLAEVALAVASLVVAWRTGAPWAVFEERAGVITLFAFMGVMTLVFVLWLARSSGALGGPVPI